MFGFGKKKKQEVVNENEAVAAEKMPSGISKVMDFIFKEPSYVQNYKEVSGSTKLSADNIVKCLKNMHSNTDEYDKHRGAIKKLYLSDDNNISSLYFNG